MDSSQIQTISRPGIDSASSGHVYIEVNRNMYKLIIHHTSVFELHDKPYHEIILGNTTL